MEPKHSNEEVLDPVAAYDRVAPVFGELSLRRTAYLDKIEELIIARVPANSQALLDVGAGDGRRAVRIACKSAIHNIVLLEPSAKMREGADASCEIWPIRWEELTESALAAGKSFDVITCLWNVLGHIRPRDRVRALKNLSRLLAPLGLLFVDVNHRYNMQAYGFWPTARRIASDRVLPSAKNGDLTMHWVVRDAACRTYGHVFTRFEMRRLIAEAELVTAETAFVDYENGKIRSSGLMGNLFYVLRRA